MSTLLHDTRGAREISIEVRLDSSLSSSDYHGNFTNQALTGLVATLTPGARLSHLKDLTDSLLHKEFLQQREVLNHSRYSADAKRWTVRHFKQDSGRLMADVLLQQGRYRAVINERKTVLGVASSSLKSRKKHASVESYSSPTTPFASVDDKTCCIIA